jgi:hypothetical protein
MRKALLALALVFVSTTQAAAAGNHGGMVGGQFGGAFIFHSRPGGRDGHIPGAVGEFHPHNFGLHHHFFVAPFSDGGDDTLFEYPPAWYCHWQHWHGRRRKVCVSD